MHGAITEPTDKIKGDFIHLKHRFVFIFTGITLEKRKAPASLVEVTRRRWMYSRSKESHLFPLTRSVKWIEAEPFDLAFTLPFPPRRVHTAPAITANREGDGLKILS